MFLKDVRKLFYKDVDDDKKTSPFVDSKAVEDDNKPTPFVDSAADDMEITGVHRHRKDTDTPVPERRNGSVRRTDANGHTTRFTNQGASSPTRITFADDTCFEIHYTDSGSLKAFHAGGDQLANYQGAPGDGRQRVDYSDGTFAEYQFENGRITSAINPSGAVDLKYDGNGRLVSETFQGRTVTYHRNQDGQLIGLTTPFGQIIHYKRDSENRVSHIKEWDDQDIRIRYASNGAMNDITFPNGTRLTQRSTVNGLPSGLRLTTEYAQHRILQKNYQRDQSSRITQIISRDHEIRYRYDKRGRLIGAESNRPNDIIEAYTIDPKANRVSDHLCQYRIDPADRVVQAGKTDFKHDRLGNLTKGTCPRGPAQYSYTSLNCLRSISTNMGKSQYRYDAFGRRVAKNANGVTTRYFWAGNQLLHEVQGRTARKGYPLEVTDYLFFPDSPALLAIRKDQQTHWAAFGHRYEVLCLTDDDGKAVWQAEYDSFGNAYIEKGAGIFQPFRLAGHYLDTESGLHYSQNRYYDPEIGRYLSLNPYSIDVGNENCYAYADGDPINHIYIDGKTTFAPHLVPRTKTARTSGLVNGVHPNTNGTTGPNTFSAAQTVLLGAMAYAPDSAFTMGTETATEGVEKKEQPSEISATDEIADKPTSNTEPCSRESGNEKHKAPPNKNSAKPTEDVIDEDMKQPSVTSIKTLQARKKRKEKKHTIPQRNTDNPPKAKTLNFPIYRPSKNKSRRQGHFPHTYLAAGHINALTGAVVLSRTDFELAGRIPLTWTCHYQSSNTYTGLLGKGWQTPADARLDIDNLRSILFFDGGSTEVLFDALPTDTPVMEPETGALLTATPEHYQVRLKSGLTYHFLKTRAQTQVHVVRIDDGYDNFISFDREDSVLTKIRDSGGQCIHVRCKKGRIIRMERQNRCMAAYRYVNGRLSAAVDSLGHQRSYLYGNGVMVSHTDRNRHSFYYKYDKSGRCIRTWDDSGFYEYQLNYRPDERCTQVTNSIGYKKVYTYDKYQQTFKAKDDTGAVVVHDYDEMGRLIAITDALDRCTTYEYDGTGNVTGIVYADACRIALAYNESNHPVNIIDAAGKLFTQRFDSHGRITDHVSPLGRSVKFSYNHQGDITAFDDEGSTTAIGYDVHGLVSLVAHGKDNPTLIQRDTLGNIIAVIDPAGRIIRYIYDRKCRLIQTVQPSGISQSFDWDTEDNLLVHTDPNGRQTSFEYGVGNKVIRRTNADNTSVSYQYDTEDNLISVVNERGQSHHYQHDHSGRITSQTDEFGNTSRYGYDAVGQLIRRTDPLKRTVNYTYDLLGCMVGRMVGHLETRTGSNAEKTVYQWDPNGNLVSAKSDSTLVERTYDAENQLLGEKKGKFAIDYQYDKNGRRIERTTSHGNRVRYRYGAAGAVTAIQINDLPPSTIVHNNRGQIIDEQISESLHRSFSYDQDGLVTRQTISSGTGEIERRYSYDGTGNLISKQDNFKGDWRYSYDTMDRLTEALDPDLQTYCLTYDPRGDLLNHYPGIKDGLRCARYDDIQYYYDAAGNLVRLISGDSKIHLEWDTLDRLNTIRIGNTDTVTMTYDALDRRHTKTVGGRTTQYNWEGDTLVSEQYEDGTAREYVYYPGTLLPLAIIDKKGQVYYYHNDINGLPQELTKPNGKIVWAADYNALGRVKQILVDKVSQPLRLTGQYFDEEIGLCYDGRRYFDPLTCTYISPNPRGPAVHENAYAYGPNVWTQLNTMGLCKVQIRKRSHRKRHSDIKAACVITASIPIRQFQGCHFIEHRQEAKPTSRNFGALTTPVKRYEINPFLKSVGLLKPAALIQGPPLASGKCCTH